MHDPAQAAVTALTGCGAETVGRFSYDVPTDTWWWSTSLYTMYGFTPGEIVPSTALMTVHHHPDDRAGAVDLITAAVSSGKPFSSRHRIVDARQHVRTVVTIGEVIRDPDGQPAQVRGYVIDVTDSLHRDLAAATRQAVESSAEARAVIEQAKGALMIAYGLDADQAFALLRWHSQHTNIKLRDIAAGLVARTNDPGIAGLTAAGKITDILAALTAHTNTATTPPVPGIGEPDPGEHDESLSA
jgi:hypothetical protein